MKYTLLLHVLLSTLTYPLLCMNTSQPLHRKSKRQTFQHGDKYIAAQSLIKNPSEILEEIEAHQFNKEEQTKTHPVIIMKSHNPYNIEYKSGFTIKSIPFYSKEDVKAFFTK